MAVITRHKSTVYGLVTDLSNLVQADANETIRAKGIEGLISTGAVSVAGGSFTDITSALIAMDNAGLANVQAVIDSLNAEIARATAAEQAGATALAGETARAIGVEDAIKADLATEVATARAAELANATAIAAEATTARAAELANATAITTETAARIADVANLQSEIDDTNAKVTSLGNAFNYVGQIEAGADEASAYDMDARPTGQKDAGADEASAYDMDARPTGQDAGDYYKVVTAGYVKVGESQAPFYVNVNDGLVFNLGGSVDKIDNTNAQVFGTTNEVTVVGSTDTGFTVSIDSVFSGRVSTLETGLTAEAATARAAELANATAITTEATTARAAEATISADLAAEATTARAAELANATAIAAEATTARAAEATKLAIAANLSDVANVAASRTNLDVYSKAETADAIRLGGAVRAQEMLTVNNDKIVLTNRPKQDIVLNFSTVRFLDTAINVSYDIPVTRDMTDARGLTWVLSPDASGQFDAKAVMVQYDYVAQV